MIGETIPSTFITIRVELMLTVPFISFAVNWVGRGLQIRARSIVYCVSGFVCLPCCFYGELYRMCLKRCDQEIRERVSGDCFLE